MHSVNPDLLSALSRHHGDGRPKDPHAHHKAALLGAVREARRERWRALRHIVIEGLAKARGSRQPAPTGQGQADPA